MHSEQEKTAQSKLALAAKLRLEPTSAKTVNAYFGLIQRKKPVVPDGQSGNTPKEIAEANVTTQSTTSVKGVITVKEYGLMLPGVKQ